MLYIWFIFRASEMMLGLPYTEAIDVWSLGVMMGFIVLGESLFMFKCDYNRVSLKFTASSYNKMLDIYLQFSTSPALFRSIFASKLCLYYLFFKMKACFTFLDTLVQPHFYWYPS